MPCNSADPTRVHFRGEAPFPGYSLSRLLPLLSSGERLTELSLLGSNGPDLPLRLNNLREATLLSCQFHPGQLQNLLRHCKCLRKFGYSGRGHTIGPPSREFIKALEPAQSSLEVLYINLRLCDADRGDRIESLRQFTALKTLNIDVSCVWDWAAAIGNDPPSPDMLLTTLLPESIEEVALIYGGSEVEWYRFKIEDHVKRLASERKEKGRFQRLRQLHGKGFLPLQNGLDDDVDGSPGVEQAALRRTITLGEAISQLRDDGVEVIFDEERGSETASESDISDN